MTRRIIHFRGQDMLYKKFGIEIEVLQRAVLQFQATTKGKRRTASTKFSQADKKAMQEEQ